MFDNPMSTIDGLSNNDDDHERALREFRSAVSFVSQNWLDELGKAVAMSFERIDIELQKLEESRIRLNNELATLNQMINEIESDNDSGDKQKVKTLRRIPQRDGFYPSNGGRSRTR